MLTLLYFIVILSAGSVAYFNSATYAKQGSIKSYRLNRLTATQRSSLSKPFH